MYSSIVLAAVLTSFISSTLANPFGPVSGSPGVRPGGFRFGQFSARDIPAIDARGDVATPNVNLSPATLQEIQTFFSHQQRELLTRDPATISRVLTNPFILPILQGLGGATQTITRDTDTAARALLARQLVNDLPVREESALLAREARFGSGSPHGLHPGPLARSNLILPDHKIVNPTFGGFHKLNARIVTDVLASFFDKNPPLLTIARDVADSQDASGAINFGKFLSTAASVIGSILKREEFEELLARDVPTDASGAINFGKILSTAASVIGSILKREEEMMARSLNELN